MQGRPRRAAVLVRGEDDQEPPGAQVGAGETPFGQVAGVVGQAPIEQVRCVGAGVIDLNPVAELAVFVSQCPRVVGHEFGDDERVGSVGLQAKPTVPGRPEEEEWFSCEEVKGPVTATGPAHVDHATPGVAAGHPRPGLPGRIHERVQWGTRGCWVGGTCSDCTPLHQGWPRFMAARIHGSSRIRYSSLVSRITGILLVT